MTIRMTHLSRGLCISAMLFLGQAAGADENPREFAGMYQISDVIKHGGSVQLTMTFTLLNPTNKVVNDGVITMLASSPVPEKLGKFEAIEKLPRIGRAKVTETFTISEAEYARWEKGSQPHFEFTVPGEEGTTKAGIQARRVENAAEASGT